MAATHDGFLHVQRLIALEAVVRQGAPFTRWLPDLAYGYGQPLLLYYAPLAYLPALAARFLGAGYVASIEMASGLALVLSALAMYVLARSMFGPVAATVAAHRLRRAAVSAGRRLRARGAGRDLGVRLAAALRLVPDPRLGRRARRLERRAGAEPSPDWCSPTT